jgi:DNA invertase Pin-like site-specific DNA recombinase
MMIGYARVSTDDQDLALQLYALRSAGCETIFEDTASGADSGREGLASAMARCAPGDVLVGWKIDRLGRTMLDLILLAEKLKAKSVGLKVLTGAGASIDTTRLEGKLHFAMLAAFAEFERELNRERTKAGMASAKRRGRHVGRPRKLTDHQIDHARVLIGDGKENCAGAAALIGVHVKTLRRALNGGNDLAGTGEGENSPVSAQAGKRGNGRAF